MLSMYEGKDVTKCSSCLFWLPLVLITGLKSYSELLILDTAVHILKKIICDFIFVKELWSSEFLLILLPLKKAHFITDHVKLMLCPFATFWVNPVRRISCAYAFKVRLPTANCSTKRKDRQPPPPPQLYTELEHAMTLRIICHCLFSSLFSGVTLLLQHWWYIRDGALPAWRHSCASEDTQDVLLCKCVLDRTGFSGINALSTGSRVQHVNVS